MPSGDSKIYEVPEGDLPEHYAAIGRLITSFSDIEWRLNGVLRALLDLQEEVARALSGEMRAGDIMAVISRIIRARRLADLIEKKLTRLPSRAEYEALFTEIGVLKRIRDDVAHRRFFVHEREMIFTNSDTYRSLESLSHSLYTIEQLNSFAEYARRLATRVDQLLDPPEKPEGISPVEWEKSRAALREIPPQLQKPARVRARKAPRSGARRRRSSDE